MFTPGRIAFIAVFAVAFIIMLIWAYRKESRLNKIHFSKSWKIIIGLVLFLVLQFIIVKIRKFL
jgi:low affinity Fe/Cu permease